IISCNREFFSFGELILVAHSFEVVGTTMLNYLSPDQTDNATGKDDAGHDVDQRRAFFGFNHQTKVRQDHDKDGGESNGGKTGSKNARPDAAAIRISSEPHDDCHRGNSQQKD